MSCLAGRTTVATGAAQDTTKAAVHAIARSAAIGGQTLGITGDLESAAAATIEGGA